MDAADGGEGRLAYIRGLDRAAVSVLAGRHHCSIAISDPGNLFVVGGALGDVSELCRVAESAGATRAALLAVKVASHTPRLAGAVAPFLASLQQATHEDPQRDRILLAGGDGSRIFSAPQSVGRLAAQVASPIEWTATLRALVELGVDRVLDLGPGHALSDMMRAAHPGVRAYSLAGFHSIAGVRDWLALGR